MKLLLDTCTFLWIVADAPAISERARGLFADRSHEVFLSSVSTWEIAVKHAAGRLALPDPPAEFVPRYREAHGIEPLSLDEKAVLQLGRLPGHHRDPFDRMLICQAIEHGLALLTPDRAIADYPVRTVW